MARGTVSSLITLSAAILFIWGVAYCLSFRALGVSGPPGELDLLRLEWISKGILIAFLGLVLFHLPPLIRRGEYQALRLTNFSLLFLIILVFWHAWKSPAGKPFWLATPIILGFCALLLLVAVFQARRGLRLPRL